MASVFRKTVTKALPIGAELFNRNGRRHARWRDGRGKLHVALVTMGKDGLARIVVQSATYNGMDAPEAIRQFAPEFAPTSVQRGQSESIPDKTATATAVSKNGENPEKQSVSRGFSMSGRQDGY
jgi:hypothetical protein